MTATHETTKLVAVAKDWRDTDKGKIAAHAALKNLNTNDQRVVEQHVRNKKAAINKHHPNEQKLREAVDKLVEKGGRP